MSKYTRYTVYAKDACGYLILIGPITVTRSIYPSE